MMHIGPVTSRRMACIGEIGVSGDNEKSRQDSSCMPQEVQRKTLRLTCPPCGEVFTAENEDRLVAMAVEHARKLHDINLLEQYEPDEFRALVRRENDTYWSRIADLIPDGQVKTVLDEKLCHREREIVSYVVHGFPNREIANRLCISERTVSTHLVNIYEKLNVHSRAELAAIVRAADRIIEAAVRGHKQEYGPFVHENGPKSR
jgi:DNA-binding CsgD family transcriptional regulator